MITIQNYVRPSSLDEAYTLGQSRGSRYIGGMHWLKMSRGTVRTAIDLSGLGLDQIEETEEAFTIGAMVSLRQLETHEALNRCFGGTFRDALCSIVGVQFRNTATVGGTVWGRFGFSDLLTLLLTLDCSVTLYQGGTVPLCEFISMKPDRDLLVSLTVKKTEGQFVYLAMRNGATDFPVLTFAASCALDKIRVCVGARPGKAMPIEDKKGILANGINEQSASAFADYAASVLPTGSNLRGSAEYRTHLVRVLTKRGLTKLGGKR